MKTINLKYAWDYKNYNINTQSEITKFLIENHQLDNDENINLYIQKLNKVYSNKTLKEIFGEDITDFLRINSKNKGSIGSLFEQYIFGVSKNNKAESDLSDINVEIKTTGMKQVEDNGEKLFTAKERLVLSMINYEKLIEEDDFEKSNLFRKNNKTIFCYYQYDSSKNEDKGQFIFLKFQYIKIEKLEEKIILESDYQIIRKKVVNGLAHELHGPDTTYLESTRKGPGTNEIKVIQPNSDILAYRRAFAYKGKFVTKLFNHSYKEVSKPTIALLVDEYKNEIEFETQVINELEKYKGWSLDQLQEKLNLYSVAKNRKYHIILRLLGIDKFKNLPFDIKSKFSIKTGFVKEKNQKFRESLKLCSIYLEDMDIDTNFEDTEIYRILKKIIIYVVFELTNEGKEILKDVILIRFDDNQINLAYKVYKDTKNKYLNGGTYLFKKEKTKYNFIKNEDNLSFHIRPGAQNAKQEYTTQFGEQITKQAFWFNKNELNKIYKNKK